MCCSDLETLFINCKPFYSASFFFSFILVSVCIPRQAHVSSALQKLADQITDTEQKHPDSVLIILRDFNKAISAKLIVIWILTTDHTQRSEAIQSVFTVRI